MQVNDFILMLNSKNFIAPRRTWKTYETIKYCYENKFNILVADNNRVNNILDQIKYMIISWEIEWRINKKTNSLEDIKWNTIIKILFIKSNFIFLQQLFIDELWYMNIEDVIRIMKHNKIVWYNWTMAQANMKIRKQYSTEVIDEIRQWISDDKIFMREFNCIFN